MLIKRETSVWLTMAAVVVLAASLAFCDLTKVRAMTKQEKSDVAAVITALRAYIQTITVDDPAVRARIQAADAAAEDFLLRINNEADTVSNSDRSR